MNGLDGLSEQPVANRLVSLNFPKCHLRLRHVYSPYDGHHAL